MFLYRMNVGDIHNDGHGRYDSFYITTDASVEEMKRDYAIAKDKLGFDLRRDICCDYEDYSITDEYAIKWLNSLCEGIFEENPKFKWYTGVFKDYGKFEVEDVDLEQGTFESISCSADFFIYMHTKYLEAAGNSKYTIARENVDGVFDIGGYGLYE